jgi:zinc D-Ala-D-Ala dipeptidase
MTAVSATAYWTAQMDAAYEFMIRCLKRPLQENDEPLVDLVALARSEGVDVAFSERPHVGGRKRIFVLREQLADPFLGAAADFNENGLVLRVEDGYRTPEMQTGLATDPIVLERILESVLTETGGASPDPDLLFRRVSSLVSTRPHIATHMSGSAIDISVLDRSSGAELDRGGPYLDMSARTPMASPFVSAGAKENRVAITAVMTRHGFAPYPFEFWHYSSGDVFACEIAGQSVRYGPVRFDEQSGVMTPIADADDLLVSPDDLSHAIHEASNSA